MSFSLKEILELVGELNDKKGENTPRDRFRTHIKSNINEVGILRDYIEECLRYTDNKYNRALQDLVNHIGTFLGFEVEYGRYSGVKNEIGHDGLWKSPDGFNIVIEVKKTEDFTINTSIVLNYINDLISLGKISNIKNSIGLYVIGKPNPDIKQLENNIIAENRISELRITSIDSLLSLAEIMNDYDVEHNDILSILKPSRPSIDNVVEIMTKLFTEPTEDEKIERVESEDIESNEIVYWITSVKSHDEETAEECIKKLVYEENIYAFGDRTPGRKDIKPGDWICFYATQNGIVAHAEITSEARNEPHESVLFPERYPWVFNVDNVKIYIDNPVIIDAELRNKLEAFKGRDPNKSWAWFVQSTRKIEKYDFELLTR
jgi:hypothetical protein